MNISRTQRLPPGLPRNMPSKYFLYFYSSIAFRPNPTSRLFKIIIYYCAFFVYYILVVVLIFY